MYNQFLMEPAAVQFQPFSNHFQYQLLPSAFKIAEAPTYICWKALKLAEKLWHSNTANPCELFKNRSLAVLTGVGGYFGGIVALPITLCLTPITLVADVVTGVAECIFCLYHDLDKKDLSIIAHRKFIVSPCQHLAFCLGAIAGLGIAYFLVSTYTLNPWIGFTASLVFWSMGYSVGQVAVGQLPKSLNHYSLNIFIGGGSGEGPDEQENWLDDNLFLQPPPHLPPAANNQDAWNDYIEQEIPRLNRINDADLNAQYIDFKNRLLNRCTAQELLEFVVQPSTDELQVKYRALALIIHPDRNRPRREEAEALFRVLGKARELLQPVLI